MLRAGKPESLSASAHLAAAAVLFALALPAAEASPYLQWPNGPSADAGYFPIGVWLQNPSNVAAYQAAGFNLYIGLWQGPTEGQLAQLAAAGMQVICNQNAVGLAHVNDPLIVGWLDRDEPDNAQANPAGGYYSPIPPFDDTPWNTNPPAVPSTFARYTAMKANDPTRPVYMNLGQGVGWDGWIGRGIRTNHPEDYPEYIQGTDIASFDIYPAASSRPEVQGDLWRVAYGVERLVRWSSPEQPVWNFIECTDIHGAGQATAEQVKAEVWMSLVHGSRGIGYFVHEISPVFNETALLDDPVMLSAVTAINAEVRALAPVLNSPTVCAGAAAASSNPAAQVDIMARDSDGLTYVFAVNIRGEATAVDFTGLPVGAGLMVEAIGEGRSMPLDGGAFGDGFDPWAVHLYRVVRAVPGDADRDGKVDVFDLGILANSYGSAGRQWGDGDFTGDGAVDVFDLSLLGNHYGHGTGGDPQHVPAPAALALLAPAGPALLRRRR